MRSFMLLSVLLLSACAAQTSSSPILSETQVTSRNLVWETSIVNPQGKLSFKIPPSWSFDSMTGDADTFLVTLSQSGKPAHIKLTMVPTQGESLGFVLMRDAMKAEKDGGEIRQINTDEIESNVASFLWIDTVNQNINYTRYQMIAKSGDKWVASTTVSYPNEHHTQRLDIAVRDLNYVANSLNVKVD